MSTENELAKFERDLPGYLYVLKQEKKYGGISSDKELNEYPRRDYIACLNLINYYVFTQKNNVNIDNEVTNYLKSALNQLSESEKKRTLEAAKLATNDLTDNHLLTAIYQIKTKNMACPLDRLIHKLISKRRGRLDLTDEEENKRIKIGAIVAKLHEKYSDRLSVDYQETKKLKMEPKDRALLETSKIYAISKKTADEAYILFKEYNQYGCINSDGEFLTTPVKKKKGTFYFSKVCQIK